MGEWGIGLDNIMCDDITYEDLHLASMAGMDDMTWDDLTYDDVNPDVCENVVFRLLI